MEDEKLETIQVFRREHLKARTQCEGSFLFVRDGYTHDIPSVASPWYHQHMDINDHNIPFASKTPS